MAHKFQDGGLTCTKVRLPWGRNTGIFKVSLPINIHTYIYTHICRCVHLLLFKLHICIYILLYTKKIRNKYFRLCLKAITKPRIKVIGMGIVWLMLAITVKSSSHWLIFGYIHILLIGNKIYQWAWIRKGQCQGSHECSAYSLSRPLLGMYLIPQSSGMSSFSTTMSSNSFTLNSIKHHFSVMWFSAGKGTWTWPYTGPQPHVSCLQFGMDGHNDFVNMDPGHSEGTTHNCL